MKTTTLSTNAVRHRTLLSFLLLAGLGAGMWGLWQYVHKAPKRPGDASIHAPLRAVHEANERLFSATFSSSRNAKEYPLSKAVKNVRVNGAAGMCADFDPAAWKLAVARAPGDTFLLSLEEIKSLPKTEIVFDFKCIEGWSQVTHWGVCASRIL